MHRTEIQGSAKLSDAYGCASQLRLAVFSIRSGYDLLWQMIGRVSSPLSIAQGSRKRFRMLLAVNGSRTMSQFEGWLRTNTHFDLNEVAAWLGSLAKWNCAGEGQNETDLSHRRCFRTDDGAVTATVIDSGNYRPGSAASSIDVLGSPATIFFDMSISRNIYIGRLDHMYEVAFEFCKFDRQCSVFFALDDDNRGVFRRQDGQYLVNPDEFYSASLASFLTFPYETPDSPTAHLRKSGWPIRT